MEWIIEDGTGRWLFVTEKFKTFDDGWSFVRSTLPENCWGDIYVVRRNEHYGL